MMLLPKYRYLFQCLPIMIHKALFKSHEFLLLFGMKHPGIRKAFLQRPEQSGGTASPTWPTFRLLALFSFGAFTCSLDVHGGSCWRCWNIFALLGSPLPLTCAVPFGGSTVSILKNSFFTGCENRFYYYCLLSFYTYLWTIYFIITGLS